MGMLTRATPSQMPLVSTLWNLAYDGGVSVGGVVLGLIAATGGETAVLWSLGPLGALALVLFALL